MGRSKIFFLLFLLLILSAGIILLGVMTCPEWISFSEIGKAFLGNGTELSIDESRTRDIILQIRLPRALLAWLCGGILTLAGFQLQALVKNPLADPYIMGVSSGAGFGANILISGIAGTALITWWTLPLFSFAGSLISLGFLLGIGGISLRFDTVRLLLAGVALSSLFTAGTGLLIFLTADDGGMRAVVNWTLGSFAGKHLTECYIALALLIFFWIISVIMSPRLDVLSLGEEQAATLGLNIRSTRILILLLTSLCVGGVVAFTGPIGFVGLMVPHFLRMFNGASHRKNLILAPLAGGIYLCLCDIFAQWIFPPAGLPVGIITALFGVPFFVGILFGKKGMI